jgi:serine/threonine protein kinase
VSCDLLLDKLRSALKSKGYHNLRLLRIDRELSCDDLVDGGALNVYAAQAIIESLNFERLTKSNPSSSFVYACQGIPIVIDQTIREGRILRGTVSSLGEHVGVIVKVHHSDEDSRREVSMLNRLKGFSSPSSGSLTHAPDLLDFGQSLGAQPRPYLVLKSFGLPLSHFFSIQSTNAYRLEIGTQLLRALMWLHQQDFVHCDLKPDNVLVEDGGGGFMKVKLCDFDSATDVGGEFPCGRGPREEKVLKFTREWVSPEVYLSNRSLLLQRGGAVAPRAVLLAQKPMDVFPLGLMLACLFSRERSARMTMLPEDEAGFHVALTEASPGPWSLSERISCDCFSVTDSCRESVRSLCILNPVSRGSLSGALSGLEKLRSTQLQIENVSLGRLNAAQGRVIGGIREIREGVERIEARVTDDTPLSDLFQGLVTEFRNAAR